MAGEFGGAGLRDAAGNMKLKAVWVLLKETVNEFQQDRTLRLAAATAYYAVFSIGPLLVLVVGLAGVVFGEERVKQEIVRQLQSFVGPQSTKMIESMMSAQERSGSWLATIIGGVALIIGASGVFGQLQDSLNTIWGVTTKPGKSMVALIRDRCFSMAMVLGIGFLLLLSMALTAFVNAFASRLGQWISLPPWIAPVFNGLVTFVVISSLFALIFKVLPDVKIRWRDVWIGALGTALLYTLGQFLLGIYLGYETNASAYGLGSAFVVILLYVYYSALILYFGAEFTKVFARRHGTRIEPSSYAVQITDQQRAQQGMPRQEHVEAVARQSENPPRPEAQPPARNGVSENRLKE
jgi:membrane protein